MEPLIHTQVLTYFNEVFKASDPYRITNFDSRFSHETVLGKGRFGPITKLHDNETGKNVAAKVVNVELFDHWIQALPKIKTRVDKFLKEYKKICDLSQNSEWLANFLGICSDSTKIVILSEFVENGSVKNRLDDEGLPEGTAIKYFYQAAQGLAFLHSQQIPIVHKDIKASNLLLTSSDNVKLANFGLVRELTIGGFGLAVASEITEDFRFTLLYVAPEVLTRDLGPAESSSYGPPSDIWALGCTFVEMLTRFPPYFEFYDENVGFYNDFIARAEGPVEKQLPYNCFSLVPTASTSVQFIVDKVFNKSPLTRITAEGLIYFLENLDEDNLSRKSILNEKFSKALEFSSASKKAASNRRSMFQSFKQKSIQSLSKLRNSSKRDTATVEMNLSTTIESSDEKTTNSGGRKRKRKKQTFHQSCSFCLTYFLFRFLCFAGILCKSISYVVIFVFIGLGTLATFFCLAIGVIVLVRLIVAQFCDCDLNAPQVLIICGIFLILLFALFFSCCMVALGEYKFRVANKSLHKSRFFVKRPSKDIRFLGIRLIKGKRPDFELSSDEADNVDLELATMIPKKSVMDEFYESCPSPHPTPHTDGSRRPTIIEEEPFGKTSTSKIRSKDLQDLYSDQPSPKF